ncbi:MAG: hypothetical protein DRP27_06215 [Thermotogae bacterium]|nr:MAG: hypothetical protein DRP27_06215 [Thermotogota bacterium]
MNLGLLFQDTPLITKVSTKVNAKVNAKMNAKVNDVKSKGSVSITVETPVKSSASSFRSIFTGVVDEKKRSFTYEGDTILMVLLKAILDSLIPNTDPRRAFFGGGGEQNLGHSGQLWDLSAQTDPGEVELNVPLSAFLKLFQEKVPFSLSSDENKALRPQVETQAFPLPRNGKPDKRNVGLLLEIFERLKNGESVGLRVGNAVVTLELGQKPEQMESGSVDLGDSTVTSKLQQLIGIIEEIIHGAKPAEVLDSSGVGDQKLLTAAEPFSAGGVISRARERTEPVLPGGPSKNAPVFDGDSARGRTSKGSKRKIVGSSNDGEKPLLKPGEQLSGLERKYLKSIEERSWMRKPESDNKGDKNSSGNKVVRQSFLDSDLQSSLQPAEPEAYLLRKPSSHLNAPVSKNRMGANQTIETTERNGRNFTTSDASQRYRSSSTNVRSTAPGAIGIESSENLRDKMEELLNRFTNLKLRFFQITSKVTSKPLPVMFRYMLQNQRSAQFSQLAAGGGYRDLPSRVAERVVTRIESGTQGVQEAQGKAESQRVHSQRFGFETWERVESQRVHSQQSQQVKAKIHQFSLKKSVDVSETTLSHQFQSLGNSPKAVDTVDVTSLTQRIQEMVKKAIDNKSDVISMRFQLVPKELGQLELEIVRESEKFYRVIFTLHRDEAREIVEKSLPILRERLREEGVEHVKFEFAQGKEWAQDRENDENPNEGHQQRGTYRQRNSDFRAFLKEVSEDDQRSD